MDRNKSRSSLLEYWGFVQLLCGYRTLSSRGREVKARQSPLRKFLTKRELEVRGGVDSLSKYQSNLELLPTQAIVN